MTRSGGLTHTAALVLQAVAAGYRYGFDIIGVTGLPSGTVYPALRRLEESGHVRSWWEREGAAHRDSRPARKYYEIRPSGKKALAEAVRRFRHIGAIEPNPAPALRPGKP